MSKKKAYSKRPSIRVTVEELKELRKRAAEAELSLSRYLVEAGLSPNRILAPAERERQERAIYHVRKVGTNLNQIAKALNSGGQVSTNKLEQVLEEQAAALRSLIEACREQNQNGSSILPNFPLGKVRAGF